ncbi:MAG TPA: hypothetical protein VFK79_04845 [Xanthobacteraceae bacterium]|nr:hypothetical protein [Xanthobacteraceae bacterium]
MCAVVTIRKAAIAAWSSILLACSSQLLFAQEGLRPGEAFVTRFSGIQASGPQENPIVTIDTNGTVGSILDIRSPRQRPAGQHWIDEPQRAPVTAGAVGQVFGVALDDANPPNIYLTSTSAFGLHHTPDNRWMPGMWGPGGPGAIYKLTAADGYRSSLFATITLNGRANTGPALGNIAYDRTNKQFFVSDLETGMIHRIALDGREMGIFDHGTQGRANFVDAQTKRTLQLPPISFDPNSRARFTDCPAPPADNSPECWNFAANGRRTWGLGVRAEGPGGVRLYYSVWSSPTYDPDSWSGMGEDDKRNTVWSIGIGPDGSFMQQDVRREFVVPDFFVESEDIARAGYSSPVSDISFPVCSGRPAMLIAERGGIRNLGLAAENAFSNPHEARTIRLELDVTGAWRPVGRYDIGFYDRQKDGLPFIRANCAGGVAFGPGYSAAGQADLSQPDQFVWITGDSLCSPDGPCNLPGGTTAQPAGAPGVQPASLQSEGDDSEVHGVQGMAESAIAELAPAAAYQENPSDPNATAPARGPNEAYLIDTDINVDSAGKPIEAELLRNDATLIGDVVIYEICQQQAAQQSFALLPAPPPQIDEPVTWVGHPVNVSHAQYSSHGRDLSHFRWGSHYPVMSHRRWQSHYSYWSHNWVMSGWHNTYWSHWPRLSHRRWTSNPHWRVLSPPHNIYVSRRHFTYLSPRHQQYMSPRHVRPLSPGHWRYLSPRHRQPLSPGHHQQLSPGHRAPLSPNHNHILSGDRHRAPLSRAPHNLRLSPNQHHHLLSKRTPITQPLHNRVLSASSDKPKHNLRLSSAPAGHDRHLSQNAPHNARISAAQKPTAPHNSRLSAGQKTAPTAPHNARLSVGQKTSPTTPTHHARVSNSQKTTPAHNPRVSNAQKKPAHSARLSGHTSKPAHSARLSGRTSKPAHSARLSAHRSQPVHSARVSNAQKQKVRHVQKPRQPVHTQKQRTRTQQQQQHRNVQQRGGGRHNPRTSQRVR